MQCTIIAHCLQGVVDQISPDLVELVGIAQDRLAYPLSGKLPIV